MKYKAHNYQKYATEFIINHPYCGLLLDMGLGKTVITLCALWELILDYFEVRKVLIIAPLRVARDTWSMELAKWEHLNGLTISMVLGSDKERRAALKKQAFIYIINRENVEWLVQNIEWDFDMVVIDELSSFKSNQSKRFRALRQVRPMCQRVVGLTGTPTPNGLINLWSQINLLDMGERLGRFITKYREQYFVPDKRNREVIFSYKPKDGAEEVIYKKISDICISMKALDYLDMPELIMNTIEVVMGDKEKKMYDHLEKEMFLQFEGGDIDAINAAGLSNKLLQMANGAVYDENQKVKHIHDRKLECLEDLIEASNGKPVIVVYSFKHDKDRIIIKCGAKEIDTSEDINKWNNREIPVAIIHPASAGHGLNLQTGGSTIIWFGLSWSLELYQQTNARLWRQGQQTSVVVHHIVTKGTVDENVMAALEKKDFSQNALIRAVRARVGGVKNAKEDRENV